MITVNDRSVAGRIKLRAIDNEWLATPDFPGRNKWLREVYSATMDWEPGSVKLRFKNEDDEIIFRLKFGL